MSCQINIFELQKNIPIGDDVNFDVNEINHALQNIWDNKYAFHSLSDNFSSESKDQKFLTINENSIEAGKYIGVIKTKSATINIFPKIFDTEENRNRINDRDFHQYVFSHLIWWMSFSDKIRFPKVYSSFDSTTNTDLLELLVYNFAYYTEELINTYSYSSYELVSENLSQVKGKINFNQYISNIASGNWHQIPCEFDEFRFDNQLNRIIKYVCKELLLPYIQNSNTKNLLASIIHSLDEVQDEFVTLEDCDKVLLNPLYEEYVIVLDYCKMFLSNSIVSTDSKDNTIFSFVIESSKLFENFIEGFIKKNKASIGVKKIHTQKGKYIGKDLETKQSIFKTSIDFLIEKDDTEKVLVDAKYKRVWPEKGEGKKRNYGIESADIYQMLAYSNLHKIPEVILFYPLYFDEDDNISHAFEFDNQANKLNKVNIEARTLPLINHDENKFKGSHFKLSDIFSSNNDEICKLLSGLYQK